MYSIHPVSDASLFATPLAIENETELLLEGLISLDNSKAEKLNEKLHVYYQILNGVSGFLVYYFSFGPKFVQNMKN